MCKSTFDGDRILDRLLRREVCRSIATATATNKSYTDTLHNSIFTMQHMLCRVMATY
jgi:hypothetical protein